MKSKTENQKRLINQFNLKIECYFWNYFKSPGLEHYPDLPWVNSDYNLIKQEKITLVEAKRLANNLFAVGEKFNLFVNCDYFIMMPKKITSISSLDVIISELVKIIKVKLNFEVKFLDNIFKVDNYRKFWENRLKVSDRKKEMNNKIHLLSQYNDFFTGKNIIIIDDVVSSGTSIAYVSLELKKFNNIKSIKALSYGSVYFWDKIY